MQTPQNLRRAHWIKPSQEYWDEIEKKQQETRKREKEKILEARKKPPFGKKVFDFARFAGFYEMPDIINGRAPVDNIDEDGQLGYEWSFYFDRTFKDCSDEESFANRMYEIDEVR